METKECTSVELKTNLDKVYEDSIFSICKMIGRIGRCSYSINGYWMSSEVSLLLDSNYIGPCLLNISGIENSLQIIKINIEMDQETVLKFDYFTIVHRI